MRINAADIDRKARIQGKIPCSRAFFMLYCAKEDCAGRSQSGKKGSVGMKSFSGKAYAKLNLYLSVEGLREDGYHELETIFQAIDLCDLVALTIHHQGGISLRSNLPYLPTDGRNLAVKAANLFFEQTGIANPGLNLNIKKSIPVGAGMAGGSTDAACVLRLLNRAFGMPLNEKAMYKAALSLGADVPFCLMGGTALAGGTGEKLRPVSTPENCWFAIGKPAFSVSTKSAFQWFDQGGFGKGPGCEGLLDAMKRQSPSEMGQLLYNSLEEPVEHMFPRIAQLRKRLLELGALGARMTGSGSAVFGLFETKEQAQAACAGLRSLCRETYVAAALDAKAME